MCLLFSYHHLLWSDSAPHPQHCIETKSPYPIFSSSGLFTPYYRSSHVDLTTSRARHRAGLTWERSASCPVRGELDRICVCQMISVNYVDFYMSFSCGACHSTLLCDLFGSCSQGLSWLSLVPHLAWHLAPTLKPIHESIP